MYEENATELEKGERPLGYGEGTEQFLVWEGYRVWWRHGVILEAEKECCL